MTSPSLLDHLTSAEVTLDQAVKNGGGTPSQVEAMNSPKLLPLTNPFFGDAPTGRIWADRAGLNRVDVDKSQSIDQSWAQVLSELKSLNRRGRRAGSAEPARFML